MTDLEAIALRQSRRSYLGTPIAAESVSQLKAAVEKYNKISGLSIQLIEDGREAFGGFGLAYGMFSGIRSYFAIIGKSSDVNLKEKAGYYGELLVLQAITLGLGTCWVGVTFNRNRCPFTVQDDETLICLITVGNIAEKKSFRENTIYKMVHRKTKAIEELYTSDTPVPDWFLDGMKAVQKAPSAVNQQPVLFKYEKSVVTAEVNNTENHQPIDLGIAKLHFELGAGKGKFELGNGARMV
ncbi:MAG TPA: nitroreductase family protein [Mobilitalea sp.]|nr:nitroreductase family protein [Mobilitalea sp.]